MSRTIISYAVAAVVMVTFDYCWLTAMGTLYHGVLGPVLANEPFMPAAVAFYLIYISGVVYFAINPTLERGDWRRAMIRGAMLGLVAYGTYDLTNMATLKVWSMCITVLDMAWGIILTAIASGAGAAAAMAAGN